MTNSEGQGDAEASDVGGYSGGAVVAFTPEAPGWESGLRAQLRRSEQRVSALLAATGQIVSIADARGWIVGVSPAWHAFTGQAQWQGNGWGWIDCVHPDDRDRFVQMWARARATGRTWEHQLRLRRHDGAHRVFTVKAVPVPSKNGVVRDWVCSWTETTAREQPVPERVVAPPTPADPQQRVGEVLSLANHELKTPLTSLLITIEMLERRLAALGSVVDPAHEYPRFVDGVRTLVPRLRHSAERLGQLTSDLTAFSRIQSGRLDLRLAPCDLATVLSTAVDKQRSQDRTRTIWRLPTTRPVPVLADSARIGQVVTSYLSNACKYAPAGEPIVLQMEPIGNDVHVSVRDQGPGLPPEEHARVWDPFYRAAGIQVQSGSGIGLGLGLHISKTIVEHHSGHVGVESSPGAGATFWFTLPLAPSEG